MKARVLSPKQAAREELARFRSVYGNPHWIDHVFPDGKSVRQIIAKLEALGPNPSAKEVAKIQGKDRFGWNVCDGCGAHSRVTVQVGDTPDYESSTAVLCRSCVTDALKAFDDEDAS